MTLNRVVEADRNAFVGISYNSSILHIGTFKIALYLIVIKQ